MLLLFLVVEGREWGMALFCSWARWHPGSAKALRAPGPRQSSFCWGDKQQNVHRQSSGKTTPPRPRSPHPNILRPRPPPGVPADLNCFLLYLKLHSGFCVFASLEFLWEDNFFVLLVRVSQVTTCSRNQVARDISQVHRHHSKGWSWQNSWRSLGLTAKYAWASLSLCSSSLMSSSLVSQAVC